MQWIQGIREREGKAAAEEGIAGINTDKRR
jgi:hypothetical protein